MGLYALRAHMRRYQEGSPWGSIRERWAGEKVNGDNCPPSPYSVRLNRCRQGDRALYQQLPANRLSTLSRDRGHHILDLLTLVRLDQQARSSSFQQITPTSVQLRQANYYRYEFPALPGNLHQVLQAPVWQHQSAEDRIDDKARAENLACLSTGFSRNRLATASLKTLAKVRSPLGRHHHKHSRP